MNLLLIGTNITTGGAQRVLLDLAGWFFKQGIDVTAGFFYDRDGLLSEWQAQYPFDLVCMDAWRQSDNALQRGLRLIKGWFKLLKLMREEKFSGVLTFTHDSNILGLPAAWLAGIPKRYGSHHVRYPSLSKLKIRLHNWIVNSRIASGLIAVSTFTKAQAMEEGVKPEKIKIIFNGIDLADFSTAKNEAHQSKLRKEPDTLIVLSVGRLVEQKGHEFLIRSAPAVVSNRPEVAFYIAGDGPLKDSLNALIASLGITDNFHLLGNRKDVPELLGEADLFVLPSIYEGLPISLLEAMAAGLPVICTDIPAARDVIEDGVSGRLVPPKDVEALASAIVDLLSDQEKRNILAKNAEKRVKTAFSLDHMGQSYLSLFEE